MTHKELLEQIEGLTVIDGIFMRDALRAVVELHKPATYLDYLVCDHCCSEIWPCPTTQAIKKELE